MNFPLDDIETLKKILSAVMLHTVVGDLDSFQFVLVHHGIWNI